MQGWRRVIRKLEACCASWSNNKRECDSSGVRSGHLWPRTSPRTADQLRDQPKDHRSAPGNLTSCSFTLRLFPFCFQQLLTFPGFQCSTHSPCGLSISVPNIWMYWHGPSCSSQGHFLLMWIQPPSSLKMKPRLYFFILIGLKIFSKLSLV